MVLSQQNVMGQSHGCGTASKCSVCLYKLICERSPYCCIKNSGSSEIDLTPIVVALQQLEAATVNQFKSIKTDIDSIGEKINSMDNSMSSIGKSINTINDKLDDISDVTKETNKKEEIIENVEIEENGLIPFNPNQSDKVLVEKKNLFGKSKWVEEKPKK